MTRIGKKTARLLSLFMVCAFVFAGAGIFAQYEAGAASYTLVENTAYFNNMAEITGVDIKIPDSAAFSLEDAVMSSDISTSASSTGWIYDSNATFENGAGEYFSLIYWNDWSGKKSTVTTVSSTSEVIWKRVVTKSGFTLKWTGAAQADDGTVLDLKVTVGSVTINYVTLKDYGLDSSGYPDCDCVVMFSNSGGYLHLTANELGDGNSYFAYSVEIPVTVTFYETGTSTVYDGSYCFYASDVDVTDRLTGYYNYLTEGPDISAYDSLDDYYTQALGCADNSPYQEQWILDSVPEDGKVYCYDDTSLKLNRSTGAVYGDGNQVTDPDSYTVTAFQAAMSSGSTITYASSGGAFSSIFTSYEDTFYRLYLNKSGVDSSGDTSEYSVAGALFEVTDSAGYVKGYFITNGYGIGFVASTDEADVGSSGYSMEYNGTTYYRTTEMSLKLPADTYTITEVAAPENYAAAEAQQVTLSYENQSETVTFTDVEDIYPVAVKVYTSDTYSSAAGVNNLFINTGNGYSLEGAEYGIYDEDWQLVETVTSDNQTSAYSYLKNVYAVTETVYLEPGTYYVKMISPSDGYTSTESYKDSSSGNTYSAKITVTASDSTQYFSVYEDIDTLSLTLQKVDENNKNISAQGVEFQLVYTYTYSGRTRTKTILYETDSDGFIDFTDSDYIYSEDTPFLDDDGNVIFGAGTITITEISGISGYKQSDETATLTVSLNSSGSLGCSAAFSESMSSIKSGKISFVNEKMTLDTVLLDDETKDHTSKGGSDISFTDTVTYDNFEEGQTYTIKGWLYDTTTGAYARDDNGNYISAYTSFTVPSGSDSASVTLNYSFSGISLAGHTLVSVAFVYEGAPEDISSKNDYVLYHADTSDSDQTVEVDETACIVVYKVDSADSKKAVSGAVYELYKKGSSGDEFICEFTTDENGSSGLIECLYAGEYYLYETDAAGGYTIDGTTHTFTIDEDDIGTTVEIQVTDALLTIMPSTGGAGLLVLIMASLVFMITCISAVLARERRRLKAVQVN